jgi:hypothetical protein
MRFWQSFVFFKDGKATRSYVLMTLTSCKKNSFAFTVFASILMFFFIKPVVKLQTNTIVLKKKQNRSLFIVWAWAKFTIRKQSLVQQS